MNSRKNRVVRYTVEVGGVTILNSVTESPAEVGEVIIVREHDYVVVERIWTHDLRSVTLRCEAHDL